MKYYSTNNRSRLVGLRTAVLQSLPPDNGLYMPERLPRIPASVLDSIEKLSLEEIAYEVVLEFLLGDFTNKEILDIIEESVTFPAPLVKLSDQLSVLELWHGPSFAFKDFGARFMAAIMSRFVSQENRKLTILVATSGDTGGAVAAGFYKVPNVEVIILYPKGKVSPLQEKQLTTLGENIIAIEIDGSFDDCQALVKKSFLDSDINRQLHVSSANSINIARLLPQSFYYFEAFKQIKILRLNANHKMSEIVFSVPSGNFGNLTAGLFARQMGLPVKNFIAATNSNDIFPRYLSTGQYEARPSIQTISNAMDVGDPSNFKRIIDLFDHDFHKIKELIKGFSYSDSQTIEAIRQIYEKYNYVMDPHGAIGYLGGCDFISEHPDNQVVILETAHPSKFLPVMNPILGQIDIPEDLLLLVHLNKQAFSMDASFEDFKLFLMTKS